MDPIEDALVNLKNCEAVSKKECVIKPASKLMGNILKIAQKEGYIGSFELEEDGRGGKYNIDLIGKINNCKAIRPRYPVQNTQYADWEKRFLPAKGFGTIIISTPKGLMTLAEAKKLKSGGRLVAFMY